MKQFNLLKLLITMVLVVGVATLSFQGSVSAGSASSPKKAVTVYGISYSYYSRVSNDSTGTWAGGYVDFPATGAVKTGYIGINSKLYTSSGSLVNSSGWVYLANSSPTLTGFSVDAIKYTQKGTYYAKADMQFYNGNGYNTYTSYITPNLQLFSANTIPSTTYEVNENNLTYGSDFYAESIEDGPDLIQAIGKNGVEGYVYSQDINLKLNTLNEVLTYIESGQSNYSVPVYAKDGTTVIDTFELIP